MGNYLEELVAEYYRFKGYFVMINYLIPFISEKKRSKNRNGFNSRSWTDIDVLAVGKEEILIIQAKTALNTRDVAERINIHFLRATEFLNRGFALDGTTQIDWWISKRNLKKILVIENISKTYEKILNKDIEIQYFYEKYFKEMIAYLKKKEGLREGNSTMRFFQYLVKKHKLKSL